MGDDMYDVSKYTDAELYGILDINNPTDRELEAKILSLVYKYNNIGNESAVKLTQFFVDIYSHFFENEDAPPENEDIVEGFQTSIQFTGNVNASSVGNTNSGTTSYSSIQLTKPLDYSPDKMNPLLTQTIKRIISIDSQYRDNKLQTPTTNFTFNLSEPLKDVVSLKLYSVQIPYNWYTVNSTFGGNFFYLKGNAPGIDNETFYYQISINSGNYTPDTLISSINYDISANLIPLHTDVSFGTTQLYYNSSTGLVTFDIDITNVFGESNYYLRFPDWSSITDICNNHVGTNRFSSLASYMGFNLQQYSCSSTDSNTIFATSTTDNTRFSASSFDANSFTFYVYPYLGNGYPLKTDTTTNSSIIYNPIAITLPTTITTNELRTEFIRLLNNSIKSNPYFDPGHSGLTWIDLTTAGQYPQNYPQYYSYFNLAIKVYPNTKIAPIVANMKYAVVFPDSSNSVFHGTKSIFQFPTTYRDPSNNVVCELNNLISDAPILQSSYNISGINQLRFTCDASGYNNSLNNITVDVLPFNNYTLSQYLNAIQRAIDSTPRHSIINGTSISQDASLNINLNVVINQTFTNVSYTAKATGKIARIFGMVDGSTNALTGTSQDFSNNYILTTIQFNSSDTLVLTPTSNTNNSSASPFIIDFSNSISYSDIDLLVLYMNDRLINYKDPILNTYPFSFSSIYYDYLNTCFVLHIDINQKLTQNNYTLTMYSDISNNWVTKLYFDPFYVLANFSQNNGSNSLIKNNVSISDKQITFLSSQTNNYFELIPHPDIIGLQDNLYKIKVTIPPGTYSMNQLVIAINAQIDANAPLANGSKFSIVEIDGQNYVQFRANINKVFVTADYRVSFYDPTSFVSCYSGATRKGNSSIQNVTWDTTIGWLLGYRQSTIYYLSNYVGLNKTSSTNIKNYFLTGTGSNVCEMIGDTAVSTNLYNYFLILLDDYAQNHLNDGLVTITNQETSVSHAPVKYVCDPVTQQLTAFPANYGDPGVTYTANQLYSFNQQIMSQQVIQKSYSSGPFVKDVFGIIPLKVSGMSLGTVYVEFGGTLQNQERVYFGPVNISRMSIKLLTDRGDVVDLNNSNWSFSLVCEQLYKSS
jgi:hypothetical protein